MKWVPHAIFWVLCCGALAGCGTGESSESAVNSAPVSTGKAPGNTTANRSAHEASAFDSQPTAAQLWARSCALCHVDGNAGAPRIGNAAEWAARLAKGPDALLDSTLNGLGQMPPLGYCMACERDDFVALIEFMTSGLTAAEPSL